MGFQRIEENIYKQMSHLHQSLMTFNVKVTGQISYLFTDVWVSISMFYNLLALSQSFQGQLSRDFTCLNWPLAHFLTLHCTFTEGA